MTLFSKTNKIVTTFIFIIILIGFFLRLGRLDHDLWFDEAGQYWIAKGQNHFSLDIKTQGIYQILLNNRQSNLDPPLFGLLLHFWSSPNNSIIWLRLLPNLFGIFTLLYIYKTLKLFQLNYLLTVFICLLAWVSFSFIDYAQELRSYSLGMFSTAATFYYLNAYLLFHKNKKTLVKLITFSII